MRRRERAGREDPMSDRYGDENYDRFDQLLDTDPIELLNAARGLQLDLDENVRLLDVAERRVREALIVLDLIHESETTVWDREIRKALTND